MGFTNIPLIKTLTGVTSFTISEANGIKKATFNVTSTTAGTIASTGELCGLDNGSVSLTDETGSLTLESSDGATLDGITVTVPSGCTMQVVLLQ